MLWKCWRTYHCALLASLQRLKVMLVVPLHLRLSPKTLVKCGCKRVLMHDFLLCPCINTSDVLGHRFVHHVMHCFQFIACFFYKFCFVLFFVDLTLLVLFLSMFKNSTAHKNWKISKNFDRLCCVYHMWVWPSTFILIV